MKFVLWYLVSYISNAMEVCPGEGPRYGDFKCNHDLTHRVCAILLDEAGQPIRWGGNGTFWDMTNQKRFQWDDRIRGEPNVGNGWCICMWAFAQMIETLGCTNTQLHCNATDIAHVLKSYSEEGITGIKDLAESKRCLATKCPNEYTAAVNDVSGGGAPEDLVHAVHGEL